ncbi:MAG: methyltransferase domain-containing protein [Bdellovibrionota bacterium]|nr:methyltransferase domain-containing protein [Bdellovibrionota bacterium]
MSILNLLRHPLAAHNRNLDDEETDSIHRDIIISKPFLIKIYALFYKKILIEFKSKNLNDLKIIEVGAGGFNSNYFHPSIITTDLVTTPHIKETQDAQKLRYEDNSLDGIILIDVLHHIPKPKMFFEEAQRCLKKGGKLIMIEPYYSAWGSLVYKNLHHEPWYDIEDWDIPQTSGGRLSDANMLMPHNIFIRDIEKFKNEYKGLDVYEIEKINCFYYLISGGLSYISLLPGFLAPLIFFAEKLLTPFYKWLAMHMVIKIEKN